jgi:hypothetical protein
MFICDPIGYRWALLPFGEVGWGLYAGGMTKNIRHSHSAVHHLLAPAIHNSQFIIIDDLRASVVSCGTGVGSSRSVVFGYSYG